MEGGTAMETDLQIKIRRGKDVRVVDLSGDVDTYTCVKLREAILDLLEEGNSRMIIGMANVSYIDSSGLGTLVGGLRRVNDQKGELVISGANPQIRKVFSITGLSKVFPLFDNEEEAARSLKR